jgi:hypothetical protein
VVGRVDKNGSEAITPFTWEVEIGRMEVPDQPKQNVNKIPFHQKSWYMPVIPAMRKA